MQREVAEFNKQNKTQILEGKNTKSWFFEAIGGGRGDQDGEHM